MPRGPPPAGNALHLTREETWASAPRPLPVRASGNSRPLFARAPAAATREKEAERRQVPTRWCSLDLPGTLQSARAAGASAAHRSAGHGAGSATVTRLPRAALGTARYSVHSRLKERHIGHVLQQPAVALETQEPRQPAGAPFLQARPELSPSHAGQGRHVRGPRGALPGTGTGMRREQQPRQRTSLPSAGPDLFQPTGRGTWLRRPQEVLPQGPQAAALPTCLLAECFSAPLGSGANGLDSAQTRTQGSGGTSKLTCKCTAWLLSTLHKEHPKKRQNIEKRSRVLCKIF